VNPVAVCAGAASTIKKNAALITRAFVSSLLTRVY
jgi:hypothetical protein